MSGQINFGTFNVGSGFYDYKAMAQGNEVEFNKLKAIEKIDQIDKQDELMKVIEEKVAVKLADVLDVIALQEVGRLNRPFVQKLLEKGFQIQSAPTRRDDGLIDCAIAYKQSLMCEKDLSILSSSNPDKSKVYGQAIGSLILKVASGARIAFSSLHSWGFQLYPKDYTAEKSYSKNDRLQQTYAVKYASDAVDLLRNQWVDGVLIGGDMNNNLDNYVEGFNPFTNGGYTVHPTVEPTNVNYIEKQIIDCYDLRPIDCIFSNFNKSLLSRIFNAIYSLFYSTFEITTSPAKVLEGFEFTLEDNCSDHKPVAVTLTIQKHDALISRLNRAVLGNA